ncbi:diguanylate cyclase [Campylobacter sp. 19-13652]|uniref:GGDEF domain-containing protein n=1 Tax=Campylobacter sp. 19-13652 TaxID=2840180 RepID=UPI001C863C7C|nr:GGDEF domain-containing protein [Campylobacter sp. 19-13652]
MSWISFPTIAFVLCAFSFGISVYFKRSRAGYITLFLVIAQLAYVDINSASVYDAILALLLAPVITLFAMLPERFIFSRQGLARALVLAFILLIIYLLGRYSNFSNFAASEIFLPWNKGPVSQLGAIICIACLGTLWYKLNYGERFYSQFLWLSLLIAYVPFLSPILMPYAIFFLSGAAMVICMALLVEAYRMAYVDTLTQIPSRRALDEYAGSLSLPFSVCMCDIDHFKKFNDEYGHHVGDQVLRFIAAEIKLTDGGARAFRYGGEEFCIVFAGRLKKECVPFLEVVRQRIEDKKFVVNRRRKNEQTRHDVKITISMGLSDSSNGGDFAHVVKAADKLLYKAKDAGRNCLIYN